LKLAQEHSVARRLPALGRKLQCYPIKFEANPARGCWVMIGHTNKQTNGYYNFIYILAWEPSASQVTKSYSCRLPALERFYRETKFSLLKLTQSWLRISKPSWEHSRGSPEFSHQSLRQIGPWVPELWSHKKTNRRTDKQKLQLNMYR